MGASAQRRDGEGIDRILVQKLMEQMTVKELRKWCTDNVVRRSRGDSKAVTATKAVDQNRDAVIELVLENERH